MLSRSQFTNEIGKNIKKAREEKHISQEDLADKAGLYRTYIGHLENSRYSPSAYVIYKISKVLQIPVSKIIPL